MELKQEVSKERSSHSANMNSAKRSTRIQTANIVELENTIFKLRSELSYLKSQYESDINQFKQEKRTLMHEIKNYKQKAETLEVFA